MTAPLSLWQKLQSFLYPVSLRKSSSTCNPVLELLYFRGRYILATQDAVYSDGDKYRPLLQAFSSTALKKALPDMKNVLVLGTGLASAAHILAAKGILPQITLVDIDSEVLALAREFFPTVLADEARFVHDDAFQFITSDKGLYDLIIVDIFFGRVVPDAVLESDFLQQCRSRLRNGGFLVLNYMEDAARLPGRAEARLRQLFTSVQEISFGINKVYVAR